MNKKVLGIKGLNGNLAAGVGFVIIPENLDIEKYKEDVYSSGRISIYGGYGHSNFYDVLVDREVIQRIKFPKKSGEYGSPVVWINIPKHNEVVIVSCLKYDKDYFSISEDRRRDTVSNGENIIDLDLDAKNGRISISGNAVGKPMVMEIDLNNPDEEAVLKIRVNGKILAKSSKGMVFAASDKIENAITDKSGKVRAKICLNPLGVERYRYEDEFENKVVISKEKIEIRADKSKVINLGDGKEPMVLGNILKSVLDRYDEALAKLTVPTAFGPSGTRINDLEFKEIKKDFIKILSKLSNTD